LVNTNGDINSNAIATLKSSRRAILTDYVKRDKDGRAISWFNIGSNDVAKVRSDLIKQ
jgi:hypothetical protein